MTSIVITVYNGAETLACQLEAFASQVCSETWELVIVDNGSTDDSAQIAKGFSGRIPNLRIVNEFELRGRPFALNAGVRASRGDLILMTDQDDEVAQGWIAGMSRALAQYEIVGCSVDHEKLNPPFLRWSGGQKAELPRLWFPPYCSYASGTSLGFRRNAYDRIGKFDETLSYVQDADFCIRAHMLGIEIGFVPEAVLHYRRRTSFIDHFQQARSWARESAVLAKRYWKKDEKLWPAYSHFINESIHLLPMAWRARAESHRYDFMWSSGRQLGRLEGLLKHRGIPV